MSGAKGRSDAIIKGGGADVPAADGFGSEIERMLMDRPLTRQAGSGAGLGGPGAGLIPMGGSGSGGGPTNTLDELMAELGMLRGERGELSLPIDRNLGRTGTPRAGRRMSTGDGSLLGSVDAPMRPGTGSAATRCLGGSPLVLPPAKGALPAMSPPPPSAGGSTPTGPPGGGVTLGPVRAQSPMATRRSVPGILPGATCGGTLSPATQPSPPGVLERQAQLEMRLEKMEVREHQLMSLISQLQQQVSSLSRAQQATQQQQLTAAATVVAAAAAATTTASLSSAPAQAAAAPMSPPPPPPAPSQPPMQPSQPQSADPPAPHVSDEDFIQDDDEVSSTEGKSPKPHSRTLGPQPPSGPMPPPASAAAPAPAAGGARQQPGTPPVAATTAPTPTPPATGAPTAGGRPNKLAPAPLPAAEWEADVAQLRKEVGALAANVVRLRDQLAGLVPGGPSPLSEEVAAQGAAAAQLKQNLTQIAMDVVSLHKGLTTLKQNTERNEATLERAINDMQLQAQTNAFNALASAPASAVTGGAPNAVAAALAATGGVTGSLEESLRSAFAKPAMRALPAFSPADLSSGAGFMPDNTGVAAAVAAFGGAVTGGGGGGGGGGRRDAPPANGRGGLNDAWALLSSFEEQAAAEQQEQQKAAIVAQKAVALVDAKVRQVVLHVDRQLGMMAGDVEERLRMYEQTIIRMAQQVDRVQRVLRELEGAAVSRIVVRRGGQEVDPEAEEEARREAEQQAQEAAERQKQEEEHKTAARSNWVKAAAMATGRFVPQKEEEKKPAAKSPHGYFRGPQ